jgi:RNA polymerase sigma-70 factor, ECF subfamily
VENALDITQQSGLPDEASRDQQLAAAIAAGDTAAWETFFTGYSPWVYRFAYHHLSGNQADAEDLCSDILLTAARAIKGYNRARGSLDMWLLGIARHRLSRFCKERRLHRPLLANLSEADTRGEFPLSEKLWETSLTGAAVNRALAGLPQRQAAVLLDKYVSGLSVEEIARAAGATEKAIESLLSRARAAFRAAYRSLLWEGRGG